MAIYKMPTYPLPSFALAHQNACTGSAPVQTYGSIRLLNGTKQTCPIELVFRGPSRWIEQIEATILFHGFDMSVALLDSGPILSADGMVVSGSIGILTRTPDKLAVRIILAARVRAEMLTATFVLRDIVRTARRGSVVLIGDALQYQT